MSSNKNKTLLKNTVIFAIGNISTKLIHFFLVPFYTYVLTTEQYGNIDLITNVSAMIIPLLMFNIGESIRRYLLEKNSDVNKIRYVEFFWCIFGFFLSIIIFFILSFIPGIKQFARLIALYSFANSLSQVSLEYLRGLDKLHLYTLCSVLCTLGVVILNIIFLVKFNMGLNGYFYSYIIMYFLTFVISFILGKQYKNINRIKLDKKLFKEMSFFSIMLVPNSIMWWITNSSDRIMVTYMISAEANGIYSVSNKLPSLLSVFSMIVMQAWQHSAIKDADDFNNEKYNNKMFEFYFYILAFISSFLIIILKPFMFFYVAPEYRISWKYSPFLIFGLMFMTLATFVGTSYYVKKDMKSNLKSSTIGAIMNIILNFILIPLLGINGAAVATCISYIVVYLYRLYDTKKYIKINAFLPNYLALTFIVLAMCFCIYFDSFISYLIMLICLLIVILLTKSVFLDAFKMIFIKKRGTKHDLS